MVWLEYVGKVTALRTAQGEGFSMVYGPFD